MRQIDNVQRALIFGSRAIGNEKKGSDVDVAIVGKSISPKTMYELNELLNEEYPLPYFFDLDLIHYDDIANEKLKEHIDKVGREIYRRRGV